MRFSESRYGRLSLPCDKILVYLHGSGDRGKSAHEVSEGSGLLRLLGFQAEFPGEIQGMVSVAGRVDRFSAGNMAGIPVFAVYGLEDERLMEGDVEGLFEKVRAKGGSARLRVLPGKGHYISDEAFILDELKAWLASV